MWRGARSSSGSRYKVRRAASLAQSIAGTGDEGRRHIGRVDTAGLARCPASGGSARQAAHTVGSETCMRPTLRDAAPLPSQWNVSPDVRGGGWALSATNRAYRSSADMTSSLRLSTSSQRRERPSTMVPHVSRVPQDIRDTLSLSRNKKQKLCQSYPRAGTIGRQALERPAYHATRPPTLRRTRRWTGWGTQAEVMCSIITSQCWEIPSK